MKAEELTAELESLIGDIRARRIGEDVASTHFSWNVSRDSRYG